MKDHFEALEMPPCPACGGGNEPGSRFCAHCGHTLPGGRRSRRKKPFILVGAAGLILIGAVLFFLQGGLESEVVLKGDGSNADLRVGQWVTQVKAKAKIENYEKLEPVSTAKASCCGSGGGCGGGGRAQTLDPKVEKEAKARGLEYYEKKTQKTGADAKVTNFGCHIQVDILENGKVVLSLTYKQGEVQEI